MPLGMYILGFFALCAPFLLTILALDIHLLIFSNKYKYLQVIFFFFNAAVQFASVF